jgi:hypothetical protein
LHSTVDENKNNRGLFRFTNIMAPSCGFIMLDLLILWFVRFSEYVVMSHGVFKYCSFIMPSR